ncbi:hypothetical protein P167DRAFT_59960 [Morchella conica CCBAS932]|uniref:Uncharacterized protein n=1 Tax=Morchella conica CCBAS932 TaxID=1392247 RepID=A0A3N4KZ29_9PEZI|nr:hypothetical protein P167DRAFT_59960 [Morchella conica CCBAS932]
MAIPNIHLYVLLLIFTNSLSLAVLHIFYTDLAGIVLGFRCQKALLNTLWLIVSVLIVIYSCGGLGVSAWRLRYAYKLVGVEKYQFPPQRSNTTFRSITPTCPSICPTHRSLSLNSAWNSSDTCVNRLGPTTPGFYPSVSPVGSQRKHRPTCNIQTTSRGPIPLISPNSEGRYSMNSTDSNPQNTAYEPTAVQIPESCHFPSSNRLSTGVYGASTVPFYMSASDVCPLPEPRRPEQAWSKSSHEWLQGSADNSRQSEEDDSPGRFDQDTINSEPEFRETCIYDADGKKITLYGV